MVKDFREVFRAPSNDPCWGELDQDGFPGVEAMSDLVGPTCPNNPKVATFIKQQHSNYRDKNEEGILILKRFGCAECPKKKRNLTTIQVVTEGNDLVVHFSPTLSCHWNENLQGLDEFIIIWSNTDGMNDTIDGGDPSTNMEVQATTDSMVVATTIDPDKATWAERFLKQFAGDVESQEENKQQEVVHPTQDKVQQTMTDLALQLTTSQNSQGEHLTEGRLLDLATSSLLNHIDILLHLRQEWQLDWISATVTAAAAKQWLVQKAVASTIALKKEARQTIRMDINQRMKMMPQEDNWQWDLLSETGRDEIRIKVKLDVYGKAIALHGKTLNAALMLLCRAEVCIGDSIMAYDKAIKDCVEAAVLSESDPVPPRMRFQEELKQGQEPFEFCLAITTGKVALVTGDDRAAMKQVHVAAEVLARAKSFLGDTKKIGRRKWKKL